MTAKHLLAAPLAALAVLPIAGCGIQNEDAGTPSQQAPRQQAKSDAQTRQQRETEARRKRIAALPSRPRNTVAVDGLSRRDSLTAEVGRQFATESGVRIAFSATNEARSLADLCAGRVDLIETNAVPEQETIEACRRNGLEIVPALQVGSDAVVLATKNESDVGGDCVTVGQARDIYRTGSPIQNWNQLGFDDIPLRATGREDATDNFQFFAFEVLGLPSATLADVRSDYIVRGSDARERKEVTNETRRNAAVRRARRYLARLRTRTRAQRTTAIRRAERLADRRVLRLIERENQRRRRLKREAPENVEQLNRRRVEAAKRSARLRANRRFDTLILTRARRFFRDEITEADAPGTVGAFRFSYYELFEEELRPLEIDFGVPMTESGQPVTFGDLSDADQKRLLEGGGTSTTATTATTATTTATIPTTATTSTTATTATTATTPAPATQTDDERTAAEELARQRRLDQPIQVGADGSLPAEEDRNGKKIFLGPGCVFPSQLTITTGVYPLTRRIFIVTTKRALERREVRDFLNFSFENSREIAVEQRLVPITDQQRAEALAVINDRTLAEQIQRETGTQTTPSGSSTTSTTATTPEGTSTTSTTPGAAPAPEAAPSNGIPGVSSRGGGTSQP